MTKLVCAAHDDDYFFIVDEKLRKAARTSTEVEARVLQMKRWLRADIRSMDPRPVVASQSPNQQHDDLTLDADEASVVISRYIRGFRVRKLISLLFVDRVLRVWDATHGRDFFYDKTTKVRTNFVFFASNCYTLEDSSSQFVFILYRNLPGPPLAS